MRERSRFPKLLASQCLEIPGSYGESSQIGFTIIRRVRLFDVATRARHVVSGYG
jgi:hypothetical protein